MELARRSLPKGLIFIARMILGVAVAIVGVALALLLDPSFPDQVAYLFYSIAFLGGILAGYILKKHVLWVLLIPVVMVSALILNMSDDPGDQFSLPGIVIFFLVAVAFPVYLGGVIGYITSERIAKRRIRPR